MQSIDKCLMPNCLGSNYLWDFLSSVTMPVVANAQQYNTAPPTWVSGKAKIAHFLKNSNVMCGTLKGRVAELADAQDLKSCEG